MLPFETFGPAEILIIILLVTTFAALRKAKRAQSTNQEPTSHPIHDQEKQRLHEEVRTLKDRIAVLERITVEKESPLEREIERLRDR